MTEFKPGTRVVNSLNGEAGTVVERTSARIWGEDRVLVRYDRDGSVWNVSTARLCVIEEAGTE